MTKITVYYQDLAGRPVGMSALGRPVGLRKRKSAHLCVKGKIFDDFVEGSFIVYDRTE
jgi:hypothetical protein